MCDTGSRPTGALFVVPGSNVRGGVTTSWLTAAGLAAAAESRLGASMILTPDQALSPAEARAAAVAPRIDGPRIPRTFVPEAAVTLAKDVRAWRRSSARQERVPASRPHFVWQRHSLFERRGLRLASQFDAPIVLSVHAMQVLEAKKWGVERPGWGWLTKRYGEYPALARADLIVCVSDHVASEVAACGAATSAIVTIPNGVDTTHFQPPQQSFDDTESRFTIGWMGSFRQFHGLEAAIVALARDAELRRSIRLLLVGDGQERAHIQALCEALGLMAEFPGAVSYDDVPAWLHRFDVGLVLADDASNFHYSPVKLWEYAACAVPTVAHRAGQLETEVIDGVTGLLVEPRDDAGLIAALHRLMGDVELRTTIGESARRRVVEVGSWDRRFGELYSELQRYDLI